MFLVDGFRTTVAFFLLPGVLLREREVHPPELDGGGAIDTTTMRNGALGALGGPGFAGSGALGMRTQTSKSLATLGKLTLMCQYDPLVYTAILGVINAVQTITVTFPDLATVTFLGWINKFVPSQLKEGEFPVAEVEIFPTNTNPAAVAAAAPHDVLPTVAAGLNPGVVAR